MDKEKVSIIMPCHNGEKFLQESINSVLNQTYQNWELIIINDNSNDNSQQIIDAYTKKDNRIFSLNNLKVTGYPASPRNVGIEYAKGKYIAFLDCDDKWLPTKLENQLKVFETENCPIVFSFYKKMNEKSVVHEKTIKSPQNVKYRNLLNGNCIGNLTGIYDVEKVGKVFQKDIHHEDYLMWLEILRHGGKAVNTNTVEAIYRESNNSVSSNKFSAFLWTWNIYRHELQLSLLSSLYHFVCYLFKAIIKYIK